MNRCFFCAARCGISTVRDVHPQAEKWVRDPSLLDAPACADTAGCERRRLVAMTRALEMPDDPGLCRIVWSYGGLVTTRLGMTMTLVSYD